MGTAWERPSHSNLQYDEHGAVLCTPMSAIVALARQSHCAYPDTAMACDIDALPLVLLVSWVVVYCQGSLTVSGALPMAVDAYGKGFHDTQRHDDWTASV